MSATRLTFRWGPSSSATFSGAFFDAAAFRSDALSDEAIFTGELQRPGGATTSGLESPTGSRLCGFRTDDEPKAESG